MCSLKHVLNTTIYSSSNSSMGNRKMGTPSKVTCDSFIAKLIMNFHVLQQFVGVWNWRVAISNELHTHQENQVDRCLLARVGWPKERKSSHRKKQGSSEREGESEELRFQWCSELLLDHDLNSFKILVSIQKHPFLSLIWTADRIIQSLRISPAHQKKLKCDQLFWTWACFCPVKANFCHHKTRSNISRQFLWWNSWVFSFMFL